MKTRISFILFMGIFSLGTLSAQNPAHELATPDRRHAAYLEFLGWGMIYSLNYEYRLPITEKQKITFGAGGTAISIFNTSIFLGGLHLGYLYGKTHMAEVGVTPSMGISDYGDKGMFFTAKAGYRYEIPMNGINLRAGIAPIIAPNGEFRTSIYLSIGKAF